MGSNRACSKTGCQGPAVATLTYNYADSTVVLGPLARLAEPHTYDLCVRHTRSMTAPQGWEVLRLELPAGSSRTPEPDDLLALARAVQSPPEQTDDPEPPSESSTEARSRPGPRQDRGRPAPLGVDGPARPGRPPLRLLRDPMGPGPQR